MWALWVSWYNLVPQFLRFINFAYDLYFRCVIAHWKGLLEIYTFLHQNLTLSIVYQWRVKKAMFRAPKHP
jgi:hypothetical protein